MSAFGGNWVRKLVGGGADGTPAAAPAEPGAEQELLVIYATETGVAEDLAHDTLKLLKEAGVPARIVPMDTLELPLLTRTPRALFITSTTGQGDPPDMAWAFADESMQEPATLDGLSCAVLALGDSSYPDFAQFGRDLHAWLMASGVREFFPLIVVDDEDEEALDLWQERVRGLAATLAENAAS